MIWEYDEEEEWDDEEEDWEDEDDDEEDEGEVKEKPRRRPRFSKRKRELLYKSQRGRCMYCGIKLGMAFFDIDHKIPFAKKGSDDVENLQMLCRPCNGRKGDMTDGDFRKKYKLPGARSQEAKDPPEEQIPESYFEKISKQSSRKSRKKRAARRREEEEWEEEELEDDEEYEEEDWDDDEEDEEEDEGWF